ncbi:MAG: tetratricopeptide repeat protein [Bacteroidia bacterium]|nr:tetratricopeptide repeat protein [Bacteroidia bacterium]
MKLLQKIHCPVDFSEPMKRALANPVFLANRFEYLIIAARKHCDNNEMEKAIEKYTYVLNQHPDNIPALLGLIKCYNKNRKIDKAGYYNNYVKKVISRVWGKDDISLLNSLSS